MMVIWWIWRMRAAVVACPLVVLAVLAASPEAFIDCRTSCAKCHEQGDAPEIVDVYCSMCDECNKNQASREQDPQELGDNNADSPAAQVTPTLTVTEDYFSLVKNDDYLDGMPAARKPAERITPWLKPKRNPMPNLLAAMTAHGPMEAPNGYRQPSPPRPAAPRVARNGALRQYHWPVGCPTPPLCENDDEYVEFPPLPLPPWTTTTTTTTTTQPPCPPILTCRKKRRKRTTRHYETTLPQCATPCMPMCQPYPAGPAAPVGAPGQSVFQISDDQLVKLLAGPGLLCNTSSSSSGKTEATTPKVTTPITTTQKPKNKKLYHRDSLESHEINDNGIHGNHYNGGGAHSGYGHNGNSQGMSYNYKFNGVQYGGSGGQYGGSGGQYGGSGGQYGGSGGQYGGSGQHGASGGQYGGSGGQYGGSGGQYGGSGGQYGGPGGQYGGSGGQYGGSGGRPEGFEYLYVGVPPGLMPGQAPSHTS